MWLVGGGQEAVACPIVPTVSHIEGMAAGPRHHRNLGLLNIYPYSRDNNVADAGRVPSL